MILFKSLILMQTLSLCSHKPPDRNSRTTTGIASRRDTWCAECNQGTSCQQGPEEDERRSAGQDFGSSQSTLGEDQGQIREASCQASRKARKEEGRDECCWQSQIVGSDESPLGSPEEGCSGFECAES